MQTLPDLMLARRIKKSLSSDPLIPRDAIHVEVRDGWVMLSGTVHLRLQSWMAEGVAARIAGQTQVSNRIVIMCSA